MAPGVSEQQIIDNFESAGAVESIKILPANSRFPTGVAYVNFGIADHATAALSFRASRIPIKAQRQSTK